MSCCPKKTSVNDLMAYVEKDMSNYTVHYFRASWQHTQMTNSINNLKPGQIVMIMDFAENYKCTVQNEVQ